LTEEFIEVGNGKWKEEKGNREVLKYGKSICSYPAM
jgi:hypothetical protein